MKNLHYIVLCIILPVIANAQINWTTHVITTGFSGPRSPCACDIDRDGDVDIVACATDGDEVAWWRNDGSQNFTKYNIDNFYDGANCVQPIDVDGDNDVDIVGVARFANQVNWWANNGTQAFFKDTIDNLIDLPVSVYAADLDGDTDIDLVAGIYNSQQIIWYENQWGTWVRHLVDDAISYPYGVHIEDIDDDGHMDIIAASYGADYIAWYRNDGSGQPSFTKGYVTSGGFNGVRQVYAADVDSDNDMDVLGATWYGNEIAWFENNGAEVFTQRTLTNSFTNAQDVYAADLDDDGDIDILGASHSLNTVAWWENDGSQNFTYHPIIQNLDFAICVTAADIDGDTDLDVLAAGSGANIIIWLESDLAPGVEEKPAANYRITSPWLCVTSLSRGDARVTYQLAVPGHCELTLRDIVGRVVKNLVNADQQPGIYSLSIDGSELNSGVYFIDMRAGTELLTQKLVLAR